MLNPYQVLGVDPNATEAEIKKAYFQLVRKHTPERDPERFKRIREAYEQLRSAEARSKTDVHSFHDPFGEFDLAALERRLTFDLSVTLDPSLFSMDSRLSDLDRVDFTEDFTEVPR
jgi:curved DNA-binding protein CbpA